MLVFIRKADECIYIGEDICIEILGVTPEGTVRIGITAPTEQKVLRGEHVACAAEENRRAAASQLTPDQLAAIIRKHRT